MDFLKRKATPVKSKHTSEHFSSNQKYFLEDVGTTVLMEDIHPKTHLNCDQTGIKIVPSSTWTVNTRGAQRVEVVGAVMPLGMRSCVCVCIL